MSYARFVPGKSDVYVMATSLHPVRVVCYCEYPPPEMTTNEMLAHLEEHRKRGELVPLECAFLLGMDAPRRSR